MAPGALKQMMCSLGALKFSSWSPGALHFYGRSPGALNFFGTLYMRLYVGYFGECIYFRRESVGFSSGSRFPGSCFVLCFYISVWPGDCFPTMWANLQAAVPPDDHHLRVLADSFPDVTLAGRASSTTTKFSAIHASW